MLKCQGIPCSQSHKIWSLSDCNCTGTHNYLVRKRTLNYLAKLAERLNWVVSNYLNSALTVCSSHATYAFESESTFYSYLNVKELLAHNKHKIWFLSDCNWTGTDNQLVRNWTLHHSAKIAKWLSGVGNTYLQGAWTVCFFDDTYVFQSESRVYSCLNLNEQLD